MNEADFCKRALIIWLSEQTPNPDGPTAEDVVSAFAAGFGAGYDKAYDDYCGTD